MYSLEMDNRQEETRSFSYLETDVANSYSQKKMLTKKFKISGGNHMEKAKFYAPILWIIASNQ